MRVISIVLIVASCFAISARGLLAQDPTVVPVPEQFASAHSVFLAQAGAPASGRMNQVTSIIYESMYRSLAASKLYKLAASPADAEMTLEVSVLVTAGVANGTFNDVLLRLVVRDRKTQAMLWIIDEPLEGAFREKTFRRNVDHASAKISEDLKALSRGEEPKP